jgi:hypothetical protein
VNQLFGHENETHGAGPRSAPERAFFGERPEPARTPTVTRLCESVARSEREREEDMDGIIYLVGLVVVILAILSLLGLR